MGEAEDIARRWFKAMEDHDIDGAMQMFDPDLRFSSPQTQFKGLEPARPYLQGYVDGFPDARFNLSNVVASGDRVIVEGTYSGTNTGAMQTPAGEVPPTGKSIALP